VHVQHRREVDVEPQRRQLAPEREADRARQPFVVGRRMPVERQHRRPLRRRRAHALHHPTLLIDRDQHRRPGRRCRVQRTVELDQRADVDHLLRHRSLHDLQDQIALEHHDHADLGRGDLRAQPIRHRGAVEADPEDLTDVVDERVRHAPKIPRAYWQVTADGALALQPSWRFSSNRCGAVPVTTSTMRFSAFGKAPRMRSREPHPSAVVPVPPIGFTRVTFQSPWVFPPISA
jgi:hypothetical protein